MNPPEWSEADAERESLDRAAEFRDLCTTVETEGDLEAIAIVEMFKLRCICGRKLPINPFGGKVRCPTCGAEVGPIE